jgi:hypothetical protein
MARLTPFKPQRTIAMTDKHIARPPSCISRHAPSKEPISCQNSVRAFSYSPGAIMLQIRGTNSYHGITLTVAQASELIDMINEVVEDTFKPLPEAELMQIVKST